jgi:hypothetical protein
MVALLAAISTTVFANVDLRTTIRDVYVDGTCEETGNIRFVVNGDDFANASTAEPVYIRLRLDHGARLCKTLVWANLLNPVDRTEIPIYLPMSFEEATLTDVLAAPPETVSIVRWKAGENEIWLRVQFPSGQWISRGGTPIAPSSTVRVRWTIGVSAQNSWATNFDSGDFALGRANLPAATREPVTMAATPDPDLAVSTLICTDLSSSNLEPLPAPGTLSELNFDPSSWDSTTENVLDAVSSTNIVLGRQLSTSFSDDRVIARGYDFSCSGSFPNKFDGPTSAALCSETVNLQNLSLTFGVVCMTNTIDVRILCGAGWGFHEFSRIMLATEADARYGFPVFDDGTIDPGIFGHAGNWVQLDTAALSMVGESTSLPYAAATSLFAIQDGTLLSREARIQYLGDGTPGSFDFTISATVCQWYEEDADDVILLTRVYASNRDLDQVVDVIPFEGWSGTSIPGFDQERACDPSLRLAFEAEWYFGDFVPCQAIACTRIFFPYLPRLRDTDPTVEVDFWTGLSYVNQGGVPLNVISIHIYESDGSFWYVEDLPTLDVRNQNTWLIAFDGGAGGVVFTNAETGDVYVPQTSGGDLVFGDRRSSLFVVGCYFTDGNLGAANSPVDLDGYLLIGGGGSIDGAYTARNFEIGIYNRDPLQNGDLPVLYDKTSHQQDGKREFFIPEGFAPRSY